MIENTPRYTPQKVDLETKFKPFIPDYIPAVGDIDAFIKVTIDLQQSHQICAGLDWI